jgi:hypothetical protein
MPGPLNVDNGLFRRTPAAAQPLRRILCPPEASLDVV